jgi:hypothetical protein
MMSHTPTYRKTWSSGPGRERVNVAQPDTGPGDPLNQPELSPGPTVILAQYQHETDPLFWYTDSGRFRCVV